MAAMDDDDVNAPTPADILGDAITGLLDGAERRMARLAAHLRGEPSHDEEATDARA